MKRRDLIKFLEMIGCELIRHGGKHDWYQNKSTGICQPIPRHKEINENLAKSIIKNYLNITTAQVFDFINPDKLSFTQVY